MVRSGTRDGTAMHVGAALEKKWQRATFCHYRQETDKRSPIAGAWLCWSEVLQKTGGSQCWKMAASGCGGIGRDILVDLPWFHACQNLLIAEWGVPAAKSLSSTGVHTPRRFLVDLQASHCQCRFIEVACWRGSLLKTSAALKLHRVDRPHH